MEDTDLFSHLMAIMTSANAGIQLVKLSFIGHRCLAYLQKQYIKTKQKAEKKIKWKLRFHDYMTRPL